MSAPWQLSAIRLVNWHNFTDEIIPVKGSLFLIGDNGAGKTTILDAVHVALSGDQDVELNAAARVGGRKEDGRDLTGILLRHTVEAGFARTSAVGYAVLELTRDGDALCLGVGAFAASPDARVERWGVFTRRPLADLQLTREVDGNRLVVDREDLVKALPKGDVLDVGRYRSAVAQLFSGRERFEEVTALLRAGKAYRELVARTANFSELFGELLAEPDAEAYEEVRRAIGAIDRIRADLEALEAERRGLSDLHAWTAEVERAAEAIARYDYLAARLAHESALGHEERARRQEREHAEELEEAGREVAAATTRLEGARGEQARLRASEGANLLARAAELRGDAGRARERREIADLHHAARDEEHARARRRAEEAAAQLAQAAERAREHLAAARAQVAAELPVAALDAVGRLEDRLVSLRDGAAREREVADGRVAPALDAGEASMLLRRVVDELRSRASELGLQEHDARREARERAEQAEARATEARELAARGEVEPPVAGLGTATEALRERGIEARPLYRLVEPGEGIELAELGAIERVLGDDVLGTLVVAAERHAEALAVVLASFPGVPLAWAEGGTVPAPAGLVCADPAAAALLARRLPALREAEQGLARAGGASARGSAAGSQRGADVGRAGEAPGSGRSSATADVARDVAGAERPPDADGGSRERAGADIARADRASTDRAFLTLGGHLHDRGLDLRVPPGPPRWLGERARREALERAIAALEAERERLAGEAAAAADRADALSARRARIEEAGADLDRVDLHAASGADRERASALEKVAAVGLLAAEAAAEALRAQAREEELARALSALERELAGKGLDVLGRRLAELEREIEAAQDAQRKADARHGAAGERRAGAARALAAASVATGEAARVREAARSALLARASAEARGDLDDYVLRIKRGRQIQRENLPELKAASERERYAAIERIAGSDGVRSPLLWQKYAFRYDEQANVLVDSQGGSLEAALARVQKDVDELAATVTARQQELLERVVLQDLVGTLRGEVFGLEDVIRRINRQVADLSFGGTRYRLEAVLRAEYRGLHELLRTASGLSAGAREELKGFFQSRLSELGSESDGVPSLLDYRHWFEFHVRQSTQDEAGVQLSPKRMRKGSGGEQAVPNYLLLFCLASVLFERCEAGVRVLLLDEAFYGIDAGRREELLRFCARLGITLVVATPEMDGVTESMKRSTTLFLEKAATGDVFLSSFFLENRPRDLFGGGGLPDPEALVVGG